MKYLKEKKEFEKLENELYELSGGSDDYGHCMVDVEKAILVIKKYFQSHDRKMLEWVLEEVVGEDEKEDADFYVLHYMGRARNDLLAKQRQLINQKIKSLKGEK